jgi:hypothetical protein
MWWNLGQTVLARAADHTADKTYWAIRYQEPVRAIARVTGQGRVLTGGLRVPAAKGIIFKPA